MTDRERFWACAQFKTADRPPRWEWGIREDTAKRWYGEGLPAEVPGKVGWRQFFNFDRGGGYAGGDMAERLDVGVGLIPDFGGEVIAEDERTVTARNRWGAIVRGSKVGASIPQYQSFAVHTREDFQKFLPRWNPQDPARYPADWEARKAAWKERTYPVCGWTFGWYGLLRELMGVEGLSVAFHEDEALIDEMSEFWEGFVIQVFERAFREVDVDYILFWEDLAFKNGPLLSPRHFRRYFLPHYRRVIDRFRQWGVRLFAVDSDGNIDQIIPLWMEVGVRMLAPFEVAAGMDVVKVGRTYKDLLIVGGIDKMEIAKGPAAIEAEIRRHVEPLLPRGGYIPTLDHNAHPDISYQDYLRYRECLKRVCEGGATKR